MKCKYYKENSIKGLEGLCSKGNHPYDTSEMGECIYNNGEVSDKSVIHCSEGKKLLGILDK